VGKVITMSSANPQATSDSEAPFTQSDIRNLSLTVDIYQSLGRLTEAVSNLRDDTKSNYERIEQLIQWTIAIPNLEKEVQKNTKDLNELGRRHDKDIKEVEKIVHTAKTLGQIALSGLGVAIVVYVYHHLAPILFPR
jgi:DNA repair exonuclease SbcCD ATPase subunit